MEPDCYVESIPKLSTLAADVIALFPSTIAETSKVKFNSSSYQLRSDYAAIPFPVAEELLDSYRRRGSSFLTPKRLGIFSDAIRTPLCNLNLEGSSVNDQTLAQLLTSHSRNLLYINLKDCIELTETINDGDSNDIQLENLRILNLGDLIGIFSPWLRSNESDDEDESAEEDDKNVKSAIVSFVKEMEKVPMYLDMDDDFENDESNHISEDPPNNVDLEESNFEASSSAGHVNSDQERQSTSSTPPVSLNHFSFSGHKLLERSSTITLPNKDGKDTKAAKHVFTSWCPNLLALILHGNQLEDSFPDVNANTVAEFFLCLLHHTRRLVYLDLSYWSRMSDLRFLRPLRHLQTLILYEVPDLYHAVNVICSLSSLRHLDLSQSNRDTGQYPHPVTTLDKIVTSLPQLTSLDISSTNLASNPTQGDFPKQKIHRHFIESDIVGLRSLRKPLVYLGIFYCDIAAHYHRIPAERIAGDANESQILLAIEQYMKRPSLLLKVLNEAYQIYRFGTPTRYAHVLQLMIEAMRNHVNDASIQIASSASIFYIIRNVNMSTATRKRVINALLTGMEEHLFEHTMVRNCCLSLCQFEIPQDLLFDYTRAARLLLRVIDEFQDQMTQRIVIYLLNSMACHVEGEQKVAVGELDAVERILNVIRRRHQGDVCDEVMEVSWSFLWNITDETPTNCERFLRCGGMQLFYECYKKFPTKRKLLRNMTGLAKFSDKNELLRNMMGLMGNIAEVKEMRSHLMQGDYVTVFCELLKNLSDGIEISYNSAGVLSHMLSDGPSVWQAVNPSREEATQAVIAAIKTWHINARRFINYRSFEPILRLVPLYSCPASQYWSIWALANLTTVDGNKYCSYIVQEGGLPLLEQVVNESRSMIAVKELAKSVLMNVQTWATENNVNLQEASKRQASIDNMPVMM